MQKDKSHFLSVVVPTYKDEKIILKSLQRLRESLDKIRFNYEVIVVVDGRIDKTFSEAKKIRSDNFKITGYKNNRGKGFAVRYGMARTKGDLVAFIDSGMEINSDGLPLLIEHMLWYDSDIIVGSVRHSASKVFDYPLKRKVYSWGYHTLIRWLFGLRITDSQRGLKIFKRKVLEKVLPRLLVKQFAFDIEMLSVAKSLGFDEIHDGPVEMDASKLKLSNVNVGSVFSMLKDTLAVFYRLKILNYYVDGNKRRWEYDPELDFRINLG